MFCTIEYKFTELWSKQNFNITIGISLNININNIKAGGAVVVLQVFRALDFSDLNLKIACVSWRPTASFVGKL